MIIVRTRNPRMIGRVPPMPARLHISDDGVTTRCGRRVIDLPYPVSQETWDKAKALRCKRCGKVTA